MGIKLDFISKFIKWLEHKIPMKPTSSVAMDIPSTVVDEAIYTQELEEDLLLFEAFMAELFTDAIMDRKYQAVSPEEVIQELTHLDDNQKVKLKAVFEKYKKVFDGTLG